jgi:hypothetical protein
VTGWNEWLQIKGVDTGIWKNVVTANMLMSIFHYGSIRMVTQGVVFIIGIFLLMMVVVILSWLDDWVGDVEWLKLVLWVGRNVLFKFTNINDYIAN